MPHKVHTDRYSTQPHETDSTKLMVLDHERETVSDLKLFGRWTYCRKLVNPEEEGGIIMVEQRQDNCPFCEILAIGPGCGKRHKLTLDQRNTEDMLPQCAYGLQIGDTVLVPDRHRHEMMLRSFWVKDEAHIHESCLQALYRDDKLIPLGNRVLVKVDPRDEYEQNGVTISSRRTRHIDTGIVLELGKGWLNKDGIGINFPCKVGDNIMFYYRDGIKIHQNKDELRLLKHTDIMAQNDNK